ncbi:carbohydrate porin [Frateuria aurantia]
MRRPFFPSGLGMASAMAISTSLMPAMAVEAINSYGVPYDQVIDGRAYLFGNWGGLRRRLQDEGVTFNVAVGDEMAHNFTGGSRHLTRNTTQSVFSSHLDLGRLIDWQGASAQITVTNRTGRNLGSDAQIGNNQLIQEVYGAGMSWRLTHFWLQQQLVDGRLSLQAGRTQVNAYFGHQDCDFENLTFCGPQATNMLRYWTGWPASVWGFRARWNLTANTYLMSGVYQDNPTLQSDDYIIHRGMFPDNPGGTLGALFPLEYGWTPRVRELPGSYQLGAWYDNAHGQDLVQNNLGKSLASAGGVPRRRLQYGGYLAFKQQLTGDANGCGLTAFLNYTQADHATAQTDRQFSMGLQYHGIGRRTGDSVGLAFGATHTSNYYARYARLYNQLHPEVKALAVGGGYEKVTEAYYSWAPLTFLYIRPNIQYIVDPGGTRANANAFVFGIKSLLVF